MDYARAKKIFSNLKPVYDLMGGDLVTACVDEGIPFEMIAKLMREWKMSEEAIDRALSVMPDDPAMDKRISDELMRKFEALHDDDGNVVLNLKRS